MVSMGVLLGAAHVLRILNAGLKGFIHNNEAVLRVFHTINTGRLIFPLCMQEFDRVKQYLTQLLLVLQQVL